MVEAVEYTETLRMMTQRLSVEIMQRRKLQHEIERAVNEVKRELNVAATHQRVIAAGERTAQAQKEKLERHRVHKRAVQEEQMQRRGVMALALAQGGGKDGKDLVAEHAAAVEARQQRMKTAAAEQHSLRRTLHNLGDAAKKVHIGDANLSAAAPAAAAAAGGKAAAAPGPESAKKAAAQKAAGFLGRKVNLPFGRTDEVKRFSAAVVPEEMRRLKSR